MKSRKTFFVLIILIVSSQICFGQEKPNARLVDEFGETTCEELITRQDSFISSLQDEPTSIGYAVIDGKKNDSSGWRTKLFIDGQTEFRRFDEERLLTISGKESEDFRIQFWIIPAGAEKPDFEESSWNFTLPADRKPFIFRSTAWAEEICPVGLQLKNYSQYLTANPNIYGNIVISIKSKDEFQREKERISEKLTNIYKVPSTQIRVFHKKIKNDSSHTELWLIPQKKK